MDVEIEYCFNCDNEAVAYIDWTYSNGIGMHRSFMCRTCADAVEFGQCTHETVHSIDDLAIKTA